MTGGRRFSALLWCAGIAIGTLSAAQPALPAERRAGEFLILAADFHVHGFVGDGALAPWALRDHAARAGLDVFTLSNHNQVFAARFAQWLTEGTAGPLVIPGQEVTAPSYHMIASGIERPINWEQPASAAIRDIHAQGGVAIAAHPLRSYWPGWDDAALSSLDGVERAHGVMHERPETAPELAAFYDRARRLNPGVAAIGSSDYHSSGVPGWCRTYVLARERSVAAVVEAVREGRTVAADANGVLYGDPRWLELVSGAGGYVAPPAPGDRWTGLSVAAAWLGLLGLVTLRSH